MNIGNLYATPYAEVVHPDAARLCAELQELFLDCEKQGDKYLNKIQRDAQNGKLFESTFDLFYWQNKAVQELREFCHLSLATLLKQVSDYTDEEFSKLNFDYHSWFHVTRKGGYQGLHNHPNASWSGIFCVNPGDDIPESPESGSVRFHDPRNGANYYSDAGSDRWKYPFNIGGRKIQHQPGKLFLFPSFLNHEIFPYEGEKQPRIVVAFNSWIKNS